MTTITIETTMDDSHVLTLSLPMLTPGKVRITIESEQDDPTLQRATIIQKLRQANLWLSAPQTQMEAVPLSATELDRLSKQMGQGRSVLDLLGEEREERT